MVAALPPIKHLKNPNADIKKYISNKSAISFLHLIAMH